VKFRVLIGVGLAGAVALALSGCAGESVHHSGYAAPTGRPALSRLTAEASVFAAYMRRATAIDDRFSGPADVAQSLEAGASHEPRQLDEGMIAYAAVAALQEPRFVDGLKRERKRGALARRLAIDPAYALELPGGTAAAARASGALATQGEALHAQGLRVKRAAYTVQHQAWSQRKVENPRGRLAEVKRLSSEPYRAETGQTAQLYAAMTEAGRRAGPPGPAVVRGVAAAALSVLGEPGEARALLREPQSASCLWMAKLNLYQCLAAAGPQYEDIFCLGQHAMADTGQCVVEATRGGRTASRASWRR
jgi:hypothetical protein